MHLRLSILVFLTLILVRRALAVPAVPVVVLVALLVIIDVTSLAALVAPGCGCVFRRPFTLGPVRKAPFLHRIPTFVAQELLHHLGNGPIEREPLLSEVGIGLASLDEDVTS